MKAPADRRFGWHSPFSDLWKAKFCNEAAELLYTLNEIMIYVTDPTLRVHCSTYKCRPHTRGSIKFLAALPEREQTLYHDLIGASTGISPGYGAFSSVALKNTLNQPKELQVLLVLREKEPGIIVCLKNFSLWRFRVSQTEVPAFPY